MEGPIESKSIPAVDRFWPKVAKREPNDCWEWSGARDPNGYGRFYHGRGSYKLSHRVAWELINGVIPGPSGLLGMYVLHRCDNPPCCNPGHLFLGTHTDNMADMARKGRHADHRGERSSVSKLTLASVNAIRARLATGLETNTAIALDYGVYNSTISMIKHRKRWNVTDLGG